MQTEVLGRLLQRPVEVRTLPLSLAYPRGGVAREAVKGALGSGGCFALLAFLSPAPVVGVFFGAVGLSFLWYLLHQISRLYLRVRLDDTGLVQQLGGVEKAIRWREIEQLKLGYYPRGKGAGSGTLVLTLKGGGRRIKHDSSLDHFPTLLASAAAAVRASGITLQPTTLENLTLLEL